MANAWHLRNDGKAFPVQVHIYPMQDPDLSSEAEVAAFMIKTNSKDLDLAEYVLDSFMVLLLEDARTSDLKDSESIESALVRKIAKLPFKFAYPMTADEMLAIHRNQNNFYDMDSTLNFMDEVNASLSDIQQKIKDSFNQQFCRVRFGGQYQTRSGNNCIWFRIASVGYNWDNVIYVFAADMKNKYQLRYITICRDAESDGTEEEHFYKARDGVVYHMMPIDEFFEESHERNPVFSASETGSGVIHTIRNELRKGNTILGALDLLEKSGIVCTRDYKPYLFRKEMENWIEASQWFEELNTRTKMKMSKLIALARKRFPEILNMDIDFNTRENNKGNPVGFELLCTLESDNPKLDQVVIGIASTKSLASTTVDSLMRMFTNEYSDYLKYMKIKV